jgi:hypothetical protein
MTRIVRSWTPKHVRFKIRATHHVAGLRRLGAKCSLRSGLASVNTVAANTCASPDPLNAGRIGTISGASNPSARFCHSRPAGGTTQTRQPAARIPYAASWPDARRTAEIRMDCQAALDSPSGAAAIRFLDRSANVRPSTFNAAIHSADIRPTVSINVQHFNLWRRPAW